MTREQFKAECRAALTHLTAAIQANPEYARECADAAAEYNAVATEAEAEDYARIAVVTVLAELCLDEAVSKLDDVCRRVLLESVAEVCGATVA